MKIEAGTFSSSEGLCVRLEEFDDLEVITSDGEKYWFKGSEFVKFNSVRVEKK